MNKSAPPHPNKHVWYFVPGIKYVQRVYARIERYVYIPDTTSCTRYVLLKQGSDEVAMAEEGS